jgi:membrane-bound ClpP family serine protease
VLFASGILLGIAVLALVLGMHFGPHSHLVSVLSVILSTGFLAAILATSGGNGTIYFLLGINLAIIIFSALLLKHEYRQNNTSRHYRKPALINGVAVSDLNPTGVVQAGGELWSATSANGEIKAGSKVDIISSTSVRLEVIAADDVSYFAKDPSLSQTLFGIKDISLSSDGLGKKRGRGLSRPEESP